MPRPIVRDISKYAAASRCVCCGMEKKYGSAKKKPELPPAYTKKDEHTYVGYGSNVGAPVVL
ncbi:hypothetical protein M3616_05325 [Bacillus velezensis]|uniref:hypothetical protein n=1 Tax=Bacillus velezensis TaxID=492670 RepID=UPI00100BEA05|nr:hypothetical protein [Bacillus velezensis]MCA1232015.1 hypothetical protein [Bacillus velezensis]MCA1310295.1 hypothetical protein [Bacillus velezensis]MCA1329293.1 hypothetical protein [Bacillus velezensis]MCM3275576.1 hypothetical protein [Bacillus velezensis]MCM3348656.1 hypothetical protein [Bacillus velezensis]